MSTPSTDPTQGAFEAFRNEVGTLLSLERVVEFALEDHVAAERQELRKEPPFYRNDPASRRWYKAWVLYGLNASPSLLRSSLLVMLYATLEHHLHSLCLLLQDCCGLPLSPRDISGTGIERSRTYLKKLAGVKFPDTDPSWRRILLLREIRNSIVHGGSRPSPELSAALKSVRFISFSRADRIAPTKTAFSRFVGPILTFNRKLSYGVRRRAKAGRL